MYDIPVWVPTPHATRASVIPANAGIHDRHHGRDAVAIGTAASHATGAPGYGSVGVTNAPTNAPVVPSYRSTSFVPELVT